MRVRVEEVDAPPTILEVIQKMFDAETDLIYIVAQGPRKAVTLKIEIMDVEVK
jgi:hypothetical protein